MSNIEQDYEDFISTVSHELRTPLTSIRGFSQTILSSWEKINDDDKKKFIKIIEQQSERLIHLVENMLAVTKLKSANNLFVYNEVDVKPLLEQTVAVVKQQYHNKTFNIHCDSNLAKIFVDKDKFVQIITNLIENSAKYSPDDSIVTIKACGEGDYVSLKFTNYGIGIDEKDYSKIFTKFSRLDNPLTRKVQGSGLGLFISKTLADKMDGSLSVESVAAENDADLSKITFTLNLPVKNIEEQARIKCGR